ncbi:tyrosine-type recombinase/integrase [Leisingera caerulea]|uniref:Tyrosine-type recombinase/integrase n=1 Tax=Leisingera caerulea TaxID=506591 RepID=A0ABY5WWD5_LEICA|nr:tyrosine-type recombinase/integrase [Leisingera caerulea]UWQ58625.1 tyrosine-type recombinase/integrase [Leisingera caerulea]
MSLILPISEWPAADQAMWHALFAEGGPLDGQGPLIHLRKTSRHSLALRYGQWLKWIATTEPSTLACAPVERVTCKRLVQWLSSLDRLADMTRLMLVDGVLRVAMATATAPGRDWSQETKLRKRLKYHAGRGLQSRKHGRILSSAVLLEAGLKLVEASASRLNHSLYAATDMRDGAMISLLALMPIRLRALAGLELGSSVIVGQDLILVSIPEDLSKTGQPWEAEVPPQAAAALRAYIDKARPLLAQRGQGNISSLWLNRKGNGLRYAGIGPCVARQTLRMTSVRVPPHFFRDAAATALARSSPESARLIRGVLGHKGFRTAERHYIHAQTIEAGRDYASLIARLKENRQ